jgi:hypothetical protein
LSDHSSFGESTACWQCVVEFPDLTRNIGMKACFSRRYVKQLANSTGICQNAKRTLYISLVPGPIQPVRVLADKVELNFVSYRISTLAPATRQSDPRLAAPSYFHVVHIAHRLYIRYDWSRFVDPSQHHHLTLRDIQYRRIS